MFTNFDKIKPVNVVVYGDLMLDIYTLGKAQRVSPEAPVLVLRGEQSQELPGGAGNVALNLTALGANVSLVGRIGKDNAGKQLTKLLKSEGVSTDNLAIQKGYPTTQKHRVIADNHHLLRIDTESVEPLDVDLEEKLLSSVEKQVKGMDAIAISDYGKGFLSKELLATIIEAGNRAKIPVLIDPKGDDFTKYTGATLIKPNQKEAYIAAKRSQNVSINKVGSALLETTKAKHLLITRSSDGMSLFSAKSKARHFPVKVQKVSDVTGAGDTVLAMMTLGMANKLSLDDTVTLANIAGGIAVSALGCVRVNLAQIAEKLLTEQLPSKVFDKSHMPLLQKTLNEQFCPILTIEEEQEMDADLFSAIQEMEKQHGHFALHMKGRKKNDALVKLMSTIRSVDFIFLHETPPSSQYQIAKKSSGKSVILEPVPS